MNHIDLNDAPAISTLKVESGRIASKAPFVLFSPSKNSSMASKMDTSKRNRGGYQRVFSLVHLNKMDIM